MLSITDPPPGSALLLHSRRPSSGTRVVNTYGANPVRFSPPPFPAAAQDRPYGDMTFFLATPHVLEGRRRAG